MPEILNSFYTINNVTNETLWGKRLLYNNMFSNITFIYIKINNTC